jgi:dTDP-4-dehydrorhamnose reductase
VNAKILVIGSSGMLGQALRHAIETSGSLFFGIAKETNSDKELNIDITDDQALKVALNDIVPDIIINAAAIVDCNVCENAPGLAYIVNARPSALLTDWCDKHNSYYVYISTDHYYTGDGSKQHRETDSVTLVNEYARTKYLGEVLTLLNPQSLIVRTNIVGFRGWGTTTFVEWAIAALRSSAAMTLFDDYFISSIPVSLFAPALCDLITSKCSGIINLASRETFSKKVFVERLAEVMDIPMQNVQTGSVCSLQTIRAESAGLDVSKAEAILRRNLPTLEQSVRQLALDFCAKKGDHK